MLHFDKPCFSRQGHFPIWVAFSSGWVTFSGSHSLGHIVWVTLCGSHSVGHILWVTFGGSHSVGHIRWVTFGGSHSVGGTVGHYYDILVNDKKMGKL